MTGTGGEQIMLNVTRGRERSNERAGDRCGEEEHGEVERRSKNGLFTVAFTNSNDAGTKKGGNE